MLSKQALRASFSAPAQTRGFAVNEKAIKLRMKAVENIAKITKAMKMVSAAKMRADLTRL